MGRCFLKFWSKKDYPFQRNYYEKQTESRLTHTSLRVSSVKRSSVKRGDLVYVVIWKDGRELYLIGRMKVDAVLPQKQAAEYLGG